MLSSHTVNAADVFGLPVHPKEELRSVRAVLGEQFFRLLIPQPGELFPVRGDLVPQPLEFAGTGQHLVGDVARYIPGGHCPRIRSGGRCLRAMSPSLIGKEMM